MATVSGWTGCLERFVRDVRETVQQNGECVVLAGEGIRDERGNYLSQAGGALAKDSFGYRQLGGAAESLPAIVEKEVGVKARTNKLGTCQRSAMHFASLTDRDEAYRCGQAAVEAAPGGVNRKMATLIRGWGREDYSCTTGLADLSQVARGA